MLFRTDSHPKPAEIHTVVYAHVPCPALSYMILLCTCNVPWGSSTVPGAESSTDSQSHHSLDGSLGRTACGYTDGGCLLPWCSIWLFWWKNLTQVQTSTISYAEKKFSHIFFQPGDDIWGQFSHNFATVREVFVIRAIILVTLAIVLVAVSKPWCGYDYE